MWWRSARTTVHCSVPGSVGAITTEPLIFRRPFHREDVPLRVERGQLIEELALAGADLDIGFGVPAEDFGPDERDGHAIEVEIDH